jgi:hypothetical protein
MRSMREGSGTLGGVAVFPVLKTKVSMKGGLAQVAGVPFGHACVPKNVQVPGVSSNPVAWKVPVPLKLMQGLAGVEAVLQVALCCRMLTVDKSKVSVPLPVTTSKALTGTFG